MPFVLTLDSPAMIGLRPRVRRLHADAIRQVPDRRLPRPPVLASPCRPDDDGSRSAASVHLGRPHESDQRGLRTEIFDGIRAAGVELREVILRVPEQQLRNRIDEDQVDTKARRWRQAHIGHAHRTRGVPERAHQHYQHAQALDTDLGMQPTDDGRADPKLRSAPAVIRIRPRSACYAGSRASLALSAHGHA